MSNSDAYLNAELFEINSEQLKEASSKQKVFICEPSFYLKANELFFSERDALWHIVNLLDLEGTKALVVGYDKTDKIVAFSKPKSDIYRPYFIEENDYEIPLHCAEDHNSEYKDNFTILRALVNWSIKEKIINPLASEGTTVYDKSANLVPVSASNNATDLLKYLKAHLGFSYMFRTFGNNFYLQILPKAHLAISESFQSLIDKGYNENILGQNSYAQIFDRSYRVLDFTDLRVEDPIYEEPFLGRSYKDVAKKMYPKFTVENNTRLLRVAAPNLSLFPMSWAYPSLNYVGIRNANEQYFSNLLGRLKSQSKARPQSAIRWVRQISPLKIFDKEIEVKQIPLVLSYSSNKVTPFDLDKIANTTSGLIFSPPSVTMLRYGAPTEIIPFVESYQGNVNDLMDHPELKPLDVPKQINVITFIHNKLIESWPQFKVALTDGIGDYRGFKETFGTEIIFKETIKTDFGEDFLTRARSLPISGYHCALVIIPRFLETAEETKEIYTKAKTKIMERGIPVQVITNPETRSMSRDKTFTGKCYDARALFGLSINIMAKIGTILCELSNNVTRNLIPESVVLGYNVGKILPATTSGIKSIPISAPLVIFDDKGAYVSHQDVYSNLKSEISLFEEHGDEIFCKLPSHVNSLIVHKDGFFFPKELEGLKIKGKEHGINVIPVSFRTNNVPRVSNPKATFGIGLKAGTILPLSADDFLMITTATSSWDPEKLGWPNPLLITIHNSEDSKQKLKILHHIFCLTKIHTGAQRAIRTPISIHYSNMITTFLRKAGDPAPTYVKYFVEENQQGKHIPRWFL